MRQFHLEGEFNWTKATGSVKPVVATLNLVLARLNIQVIFGGEPTR